MQRKLAKLSYRLITSSLRMPVFSLLKDFENAERLSKDQLLKHQWDKLQKLIKHAVLHSPYYRKVFADLGSEPEDIKDETTFREIPVLTKDIIREKADEIVVRPKPHFLTQAKTSGSTGKPLKFYKDPIGRASTYAAMYRGHIWHGADIGDKEARLWNVPTNRLEKVNFRATDILLNRIRQSTNETSDRIFINFFKAMEEFKPKYLMGYPSLILLYANFLQREGLDGKGFQLIFVKCTGEIITDYQRDVIEEVFGCPCISEYGAAETGVISFECPSRNNHIISNSVFAEFLVGNSGFKKAPQKLIITNLYNYCFPIIRYDIGDLAYPQYGQCDCGSLLPVMSKVIGRVQDVIVGHNGKHFHSSMFAPLMKRLAKKNFPIKEFRFVQNEPGKLQMHLVRSTNFTVEHSKAIKCLLLNAFQYSVSVNIVYRSQLNRDLSGKFRYFVSELNQFPSYI